MTEPDDHQLLVNFARVHSEAAFAALVSRHIPLVYSTALRSTGNPHAAGEITQAVFIILARKAAGFSRTIILSGWLYRTTRLTAANFLRSEIRRQKREQEAYMQSTLNEPESEAWRQIAPLLDGAMEKLGRKDHDALVLRFFENKNFAEVGAALGASEDAAKMRVIRALEKLRKFFTKRGVSSTAAILAGAISANSVQAAPLDLTQKIISAVANMAVTLAIPTFFASVLGKMLATGGLITFVVVGAAIYFHTAGNPSHHNLQASSHQTVASSNKNSPASLLQASNITNARPILDEDSKLNDAIAHLRLVLHTRPTTHILYNYEQITNAIEEFGLYRREAFNVLQDCAADPEEFVRGGAIAGMGYLGKYLPETPAILWNMIYTSDSHDRYRIFMALQTIGFQPWDVPALTGLLTNGPVSDETVLTKFVPKSIAGLIEANAQAVDPYIRSVENLLDDANPDIRFRAALALIKSEGTNNPKIFNSLHELFQRPNNRLSEYYKNLAAGTLGDVGPAAQPLVPDLLSFAMSASEIGAQEAIYAAVAKIEPDAISQSDEVAKALKEQADAKMWKDIWRSGSYSFDDLRAALKDPNQAMIAANHLAEMGANAIGAVPDMIGALWGKDEDTRNKILEDIHKINPRAVVRKISMDSIITGNLHEFLDKQPPTQQNKMLQQDVVTLELFSGWCLPDELADFTNKLAQQNLEAYKIFVDSNQKAEK